MGHESRRMNGGRHNPQPLTLDPEEHRAGEHTEKRSAGRAGEHKGRERGQASTKKKPTQFHSNFMDWRRMVIGT